MKNIPWIITALLLIVIIGLTVKVMNCKQYPVDNSPYIKELENRHYHDSIELISLYEQFGTLQNDYQVLSKKKEKIKIITNEKLVSAPAVPYPDKLDTIANIAERYQRGEWPVLNID